MESWGGSGILTVILQDLVRLDMGWSGQSEGYFTQHRQMRLSLSLAPTTSCAVLAGLYCLPPISFLLSTRTEYISLSGSLWESSEMWIMKSFWRSLSHKGTWIAVFLFVVKNLGCAHFIGNFVQTSVPPSSQRFLCFPGFPARPWEAMYCRMSWKSVALLRGGLHFLL